MDKYKYLCLSCSNNKNIFVKNHSYLAEQARKAIFTIRNYSHSLRHLTTKLSLRVFEAQIEPILMYGSKNSYYYGDENVFCDIPLGGGGGIYNFNGLE